MGGWVDKTYLEFRAGLEEVDKGSEGGGGGGLDSHFLGAADEAVFLPEVGGGVGVDAFGWRKERWVGGLGGWVGGWVGTFTFWALVHHVVVHHLCCVKEEGVGGWVGKIMT